MSRVTRRHFLLASALVPRAGKTFGISETFRAASVRQEVFSQGISEGALPEGYSRLSLSELDGEKLLALVGESSGSVSDDAARTWGSPFPFLQEGKRLRGRSDRILRLSDGRLGMVYTRQKPGYSTPHQEWCFCWSEDQGRNWSKGVLIDGPGLYAPDHGVFQQVGHGSMRQLATGRILIPFYWQFNGLHEETRQAAAYGRVRGQSILLEVHGHRPQIGGCYAYYSDDLGETWNRSVGSIMVWPLPNEDGLGGFGGTYEPVVQELKDGRVLMLMRTKVGRLFQSISSDGGKNWLGATPTQLSSGDVPCDIGRLRSTGHLLLVWNQTTGQEVRDGYFRSRLSVALSKDEAKSWENFRTLECSAGLDPTLTYASPARVQHIRTKKEVGNLPDGFSMYHYPRLAFVQGKVVIIYQADTEPAGKALQLTWHGEAKVRVVPEEWFYS